MPDPFAAISLAASILTFLEFSGRLVKTGYTVHQSREGTTPEETRLEQVTEDLANLSRQLSDSLRSSQGPLSHDDHQLQQMGEGCQDLAAKLLGVLDRLKVTDSGPRRTWESFRKSLKRATKKPEIVGIATQLDTYRQQITVRLLNVLRYEGGFAGGYLDYYTLVLIKM